MTTTKFTDLYDETQEFIRTFAHDSAIALSGVELNRKDTFERNMRADYENGGYTSDEVQVESVIFKPTNFWLRYKGASISGPVRGVEVETRRLEDGAEADSARTGPQEIEDAVEKACGFMLDPTEFDEPEMDF